MILAGDIGGTNTRLALFDLDLRLRREQTLSNAQLHGLESAVEEFLTHLASPPTILAACFGVAGPVADGQVKLTNLNWVIDERRLAETLGINRDRVKLINDLRAHAEAVELLKPADLIVLKEGIAEPSGNRVVIAAGTGLGEAGLVWDERIGRHQAVASEGGHCDFAPRGDREWALLNFLIQRNLPTSWEAVLSGPGLRHIYDFLISENLLGPSAALTDADPTPAAISAAAIARSNPACERAVEMFIAFYGAEAGNLALKFLAAGGVYLAGGIAASLAAQIAASPTFPARFSVKGSPNIQRLLSRIPICIINTPLSALYGAANHARHIWQDVI